MKNARINEYKRANEILKNYMENKDDYRIIHFARENHFDDKLPVGSRVISIAVLEPKTESMFVYSLCKSAEEVNKIYLQLTEQEKNDIEKRMLESYFSYIANHDNIWLHWNMKNDNFGFRYLEKRYQKLGGTLSERQIIRENKKINISSLFKMKYGPNYISPINAVKGKLYALLDKNKLFDIDLMNGAEEVRAYHDGNLIAIELSVIAKVKMFVQLLDYAVNGELQTECKRWRDIYGLSISGIFQYAKENVWLAVICSIVSGIVVNIICILLNIV